MRQFPERLILIKILAAGSAPLAAVYGLQARAQGVTPPPAPVSAQLAPDNGGARPAASIKKNQLEEVVVTAQRRTENQQHAAVAVDVIRPTTLANAGVVTTSTLNSVVPALNVAQSGGANTSYFIRGVGNFTVNAYADPAVAFNYDGVYVGRPTSTTAAFFDLARIEVLKGPQGILYGRNATGGAINVIPVKPSLGGYSGYLTVGGGSYGAVNLEGAVNIPLTNELALRVSGKVIHDDGTNKDGTNDEVGQTGRIQLLYKPSDDLSIRISGDYEHQGGAGPGASINGVLGYVPGAPGAPDQIANYRFTPAPSSIGPFSGLHTPAAEAYFARQVVSPSFINPAPSLYPSDNNDFWGTNAEIVYRTGFGTATWIPAMRDSRLQPRFNGPDFYEAITPEHDRQYSSELRFEGKPIGPIDWLGGFYYFKEDIGARYTFDQYALNVYQRLTTSTESFAGFGRLVYHVTDKLRLVGGARYTSDSKTFDLLNGDTLVELCANAPPPFGPGCFGGPSVPPAASLSALPIQLLPTPNGPPVPYGTHGNLLVDTRLVQNSTLSSDRLTYRGAVEYDLAPRSLLYASYETGYRSGGFSASKTYPEYAPEFIKATTIGSKNRFLDNRLQLNIEAFYWDYTNQQVSHFGIEADGSTNLFTQNLGASTIKGFDVDATALVLPDTLLRGSFQYLDNRIDKFIYTNPYGGTNLPPVTGCAITTPASVAAPQVYTINCSGRAGYNSPKFAVNLGVDQTIGFGRYALLLSADLHYRSNRTLGFEQLPQQMSHADTTLDLNARFGPLSDSWSFGAFIHNVTNAAVAEASQYLGSNGGLISTNYGPPRTFGALLTKTF